MSNFYATDADGNEFKTKAALKRFVAATPDELRLQDTAFVDNRGVLLGFSSLRPTDVIVGPNPWNNRKFYANNLNGKVV